jgi:hypothetical protein
VAGHPIIGQGGGWRATPLADLGWTNHPSWLGHPQKAKNTKQKKELRVWGVAGTPPRAWRWFRPPHTADLGVAEPPPKSKPFFFFWFLGLLGVVSTTPYGRSTPPKTQTFFFFLVSRPSRGGRTTPKGLGVVLTTPYGRYGGGRATPKAFGVVRPPPNP